MKLQPSLILSFLILVLISTSLFSQTTFKVINVEGTVKIQKSGSKSWKDVGKGDDISDNDILESFFKSKVTLQYGTENSAIIGPNTKLLLKIEENEDGDNKKSSSSFTVFNGGLLIKTVPSFPATIYTSTGVTEVDSGTITTIVESKTGNTGVQVLGGIAKIKSVSSQSIKSLPLGMTSIILPGKDPSAPLYITYRHVSVLKQFFGEKYIERQIEVSGIKPTEDASSSRLRISDDLKSKGEIDGDIQKRLFVKDRVWGSILDNEEKVINEYTPIIKPYRITDKKGELYFKSSFGMTNGVTYPRLQLVTSVYKPKVSMGLNIPIAKNSSQKMSMNFAGADGIIEKIDHITFGNVKKKRFFSIESIEDYTIGRGLVVNNFNNKNIYTVTQPLGIKLQLTKNQITNLEAFIADISSWKVGGIHLGLNVGDSWLSFGYYFDGNQMEQTVTSKNSRFLPLDSRDSLIIINPDIASNAHIISLGLSHSFILDKFNRFMVLMQFAGKAGSDISKGYVIDGPELNFAYKKTTFGLGYLQQNGKMLYSYFDPSYMSNRNHFYGLSNDTMNITTYNMLDDGVGGQFDNENIPSYEMANTAKILPNSRRSYGIKYFVKSTPKKGVSIEFNLYHDFLNKKKYSITDTSQINSNDSTKIHRTVFHELKRHINFSYNLSVSIDENLTKFIKYGKIYLRQEQGSYFPSTGSIFASWSFEAGLRIMSTPLIANLALDLGYTFSYIDLNNESATFGIQNNSIDAGDNLSEFYFGIRWGFEKKKR